MTAMSLPENILEPFAGDDPSGEDLYYSDSYDKIKEARRQEDSGPAGVWEHAVKEFEPGLVIRLAVEALTEKSKDLQIAVWLTEALTVRDALPGLVEGLELIRGLIENFWETLYPAIEDDDLEFRAAPLDWLGSYLEPSKSSSPTLAVKRIAVANEVSWIDYEASRLLGYEKDCTTKDKKRVRKEGLEAGKTAPEDVDSTIDKTHKDFYKKLSAQLQASRESLQSLDELCEEKFGEVAPSFRLLKTTLEEIHNRISVILKEKLVRDPDPVEVEAPEEEEAVEEAEAEELEALEGEDGSAPALPAGQLLTREPTNKQEAIGHLVAVAGYLRRTEPASPVPYLVLRAIRWGELRSSGQEVNAALLAAPSTRVRSALKRHAGAGRWKEVLDTAEAAMGEACGRGWLDLQRYAIQACTELGFNSAAEAIRSALKALLADYPQLPNQTLSDDTGAANPDTIAWLQNDLNGSAEEADASQE